MAKAARPKPLNFTRKLKEIREYLGFSQNEMLRALGLAETSNRSLISGFELGTKEPSLITLIAYADLAKITVDAIVRDNIDLDLSKKLPRADLPESLPSEKKGKGIKQHK
ncbi:MAG TPA: helix-turn-helix transcriptional regulator [Pyrinomonadaceae bacterium]|jgi:transcriptional regulator with XRE-family HTH domain